MKLHELKPAAGSTHSERRIGRGTGSGLGGTSTRGHKGAKARSGYKKKIGFEGGQMPLQRRVPKAGFKNINHKEYFAVNLSTLQKLAETKNLTKIGIAELKAAGLTNGKELVKILGNGELKAKSMSKLMLSQRQPKRQSRLLVVTQQSFKENEKVN